MLTLWRICKNKYENILHKYYKNSQINTNLNTSGSIIRDIVRVIKFETELKIKPLFKIRN